ncbi:hypothetical protein ACOSP7_003771 [Xanthoceras sorbifolium]
MKPLGNSDQSYVESLRSSCLQRKSKDTEVAVRIIDDEIHEGSSVYASSIANKLIEVGNGRTDTQPFNQPAIIRIDQFKIYFGREFSINLRYLDTTNK